MQKRLLSCLLAGALLSAGTAQAQTAPTKISEARFGANNGSFASTLLATADGGHLLGGYSYAGANTDKSQPSQGLSDFWVVKTNAAGQKLWDASYGGPADDKLAGIIATTDGGYLLGGTSESGAAGDRSQASRGGQDYWVVKINATGQKVWDVRFGGSGNDRLMALCATLDGGYLLAGYSTSGASGDKSQANQGVTDGWVVKIDAAGQKLWDANYGGNFDDELRSMVPTAGGDFVLAGLTSSTSGTDISQAALGGTDAWALKINASGTRLWSYRYGGSGFEDAYALTATTDGGYALAGSVSSGVGGDVSQPARGNADCWLLKISANGSRSWDARAGGPTYQWTNALVQTTDGGFALAGPTFSGAGGDKAQPSRSGYDVWLTKFSATGSLSWETRLGGPGNEEPAAILQAADGSYTVLSHTDSPLGDDLGQGNRAGGTDYWLLRLSNAPIVSSFIPAYGRTGSTVTLSGQRLNGASSVRFEGGSGVTTTAISNNTATSLSVSVPAGASTGLLTVTTAAGSGSSPQAFIVDDVAPTTIIVSGPLPETSDTTASFIFSTSDNPGGSGTATVEASLDGAAFTVVGNPLDFTGLSLGTHTLRVQATDSAGNVESPAVQYVWEVIPPDLVVYGLQNIPGGTYRNVTITDNGVGTLTGDVTVTGSFRVEQLGQLKDGCHRILGPGDFELGTFALLSICSPQGISASGPSGMVQVTGRRFFSPQAQYSYDATAAQVTGSGLPAEVWMLYNNTSNGLTLTQPLAIRLQMMLMNAGHLYTNGHRLLLRSEADTSAQVLNMSPLGSRVVGAVTVQRAVSSSARNQGLGYRHYAAPVTNTTVADLQTTGFVPRSVGAAYNNSATPNLVTPFPNVFGYDESRVLTSPATTYAPFDRGWFSPAANTAALEPGRGYTVNISGGEIVDFVGTLHDGPLVMPLTRSGGAESGWHLLGNPYPGPIDYRLMDPADLVNLDAAIHVFESTSQYGGQYRSYVNGMPGDFHASRVATGQGFFMRVSAGHSSGSFTFRNAQRVNSNFYDTEPFQRTTADQRPQLHLAFSSSTGLSDNAYLYAETGATPAFDGAYDAAKLPNSHGLNLTLLTPTGQELAISGLPAFTAGTVVPLRLTVPAAGSYALTTTALLNLPAGLTAFLRDAATGQQTNLAPQATITLTLPAGLSARYSLVFAPATALASAPALTPAEISLSPNPSSHHADVRVALPVAAGRSATVMVINALGQVVRSARTLPVAAGQALGLVPTTGLAPGVYTLRFVVGDASVSKRLVVQ